MNKQIRRLGVGLLACYVLLFVQLNVLQVVRADSYNANPLNTRQVVRDFSRPRGLIQTADGVILAQSVPSNDRFKFQRVYPTKDLFADVTGFFAFTFGSDGVERSYNDVLAGPHRPAARASAGTASSRTRSPPPTSRSAFAPDAADRWRSDALGERQGSVVALDPRDGAILAMWSFPSYDPNLLATHDFEAADTAREGVAQAAPGKPLVPATYRERYFPGSTFKVVTASAGLQSGQVTPDQPGLPVGDELHAAAHDEPDRELRRRGVRRHALQHPARVVQQRVRADGRRPRARDDGRQAPSAYGFNAKPPIDLPAPAASFFPPVDVLRPQHAGARRKSAIGQNDVQATPLQMALVAAGVANGGVIDASARDARGPQQRRRGHRQRRRGRSGRRPSARSERGDHARRDDRRRRARHGDADADPRRPRRAARPARRSSAPIRPRSHAWIIGFAPADNPRGRRRGDRRSNQSGASEQTGGRVAAPIAKAVMQTHPGCARPAVLPVGRLARHVAVRRHRPQPALRAAAPGRSWRHGRRVPGP